MNKPVVAALNGVAAGAGAAFAMAADFRVMVDTAGINLAFAGIALSCDSGSSWWLPRLVGPAKAKELLLLPRTVRAAECLDLGLVTRVVAADELATAVRELADHAGRRPDAGLRLDPPGGGLQRGARPERVAGAGGRVHGADRRQRGPSRGRRGVPGQGAAGVHRTLDRRRAAVTGAVAAQGT